MMVPVLLRLRASGLLDAFPALAAYGRAYAAQAAAFRGEEDRRP